MSAESIEGRPNATMVSESEIRTNYGLNAGKFIADVLKSRPGGEAVKVNDGYLRCERAGSEAGRVLFARHTHDAGDLLAGIYDRMQPTDQVDSYYFVHPDGEVTVFEDDMIRDRELEEAGEYAELRDRRLQKPQAFLDLSERAEVSNLRQLTHLLHEVIA